MTDFRGAGSGLRADWETQAKYFDPVNEVLGFNLDAAANSENTKCEFFISEEMDAFKVPWSPDPFFLNFPWGTEYRKRTGKRPINWIDRALSQIREGKEGAILCPSSTNSIWWNRVTSEAQYVLFPLGRVAYYHESLTGASSPNFDSSWIIYRNEFLDQGQLDALNKVGLLVKIIREVKD